MNDSTLKAMLKRDFNYDLNISGGFGGSIKDPIIILPDTESKTNETEKYTLRGIGLGRNILWRSLGADFIDFEGKTIKKTKVETKTVSKDEIITQVENYYFFSEEWEKNRIGTYCDNFIIHSDKKSKLHFPYEISWLHFDEFTDYEKKEPGLGLGYSLGYNAPLIKSTIYVYDNNLEKSATIDDDLLFLELKKAKNNIYAMYGEKAFEHDWGEQKRVGWISNYFILKDDPKNTSFIIMTEKNGHFIKIRGTFFDEIFMRDISKDFVQTFFSEVS
jgi:hypothetical protein